MTVKNEGQRAGEFIVSEGNGAISREKGTLASGQNVVDGQAVKLSGGKLVAATGSHHTDGSSDEAIAGLVIGSHNVMADTPVAYVARMAEVKASAIKLSTATGGGKTAADAAVKGALGAQFVVAR